MLRNFKSFSDIHDGNYTLEIFLGQYSVICCESEVFLNILQILIGTRRSSGAILLHSSLLKSVGIFTKNLADMHYN